LVLRLLCSHLYADGGVECKGDLNASRALLVLEHNIKKERFPQYRLLFRFLCSHPYANGMVEWKEDLNASRALLVLERTILKMEG